MAFIRVDFPAPLAPISPTTSPGPNLEVHLEHDRPPADVHGDAAHIEGRDPRIDLAPIGREGVGGHGVERR